MYVVEYKSLGWHWRKDGEYDRIDIAISVAKRYAVTNNWAVVKLDGVHVYQAWWDQYECVVAEFWFNKRTGTELSWQECGF